MAIRAQLPMDQRVADRGGRVLVVCSDLFFSTQVASMVRQAGFDAVLEMQPARAAGLMASGCWEGLVVDVEANGLDLAALVQSLGPPPRPRVVAFGPHVQTERLEAAQSAGCEAVLTRGQISSNPSGLRVAILGDRDAPGCKGTCDHRG
jgi:AmiR/NasT family two-component response regulator